MWNAAKFSLLGAILSALLIPGLSLAFTPPANHYPVALQSGGVGHWNVTPAPDGNYYVPYYQSFTFTFYDDTPGTYVPGMVVDDPTKWQGYYIWKANPIPGATQQSYTVKDVVIGGKHKARVINAGVQSKSALPQYPNVGPKPTPMWGKTFRYKDPLTLADFNDDGTNSKNPAVNAGSITVGGVTYLLKRLQDSTANFITFQGGKYVVYSAVPQDMTIDYAYKHAANYYSSAAIYDKDGKTPLIDFAIPVTVNSGQPTALAANQPPNPPLLQDKGATGEWVYLTKPPADPKSLFFIPNLPNSSGQHNGLTANIYFVIDPFLGKPGYWPSTGVWPNGTFHLTPYGWALDPRTVAQAYNLQLLDQTGGQTSFAPLVLFQAAPTKKNIWKHTIQGADPNSGIGDLLKPFFAAVKADPQYPFPGKTSQSGNYPSWFANAGLYLHVQPMPGFQRNLLRYYTAWGAYNLWNQTSDLFVRKDGTVELPAVIGSKGWRHAPVVTQTWDGSQRYTVLNTTTGPIPSTYDDYPGAEYYLPGNVYLPGKAGVVTAYVNYLVRDLLGLTPRETDLWLGLKDDGVKNMLFWADAPVNNRQTEPGGQANKPYMFGATTKLVSGQWTYYCRLQSSNSFCIARLPQAALQGKLYSASFYVDAADGKGHQLIATLTYQWQPWTIDPNGKWVLNNGIFHDNLGSGVPQLTYAKKAVRWVSIQAAKPKTNGWNFSSRIMKWDDPEDVDPNNLKASANTLNGPPREYFVTGLTNNPRAKFLIVLH